MAANNINRRTPEIFVFESPKSGLDRVYNYAQDGNLIQAMDICEGLLTSFPENSELVCAKAWDIYDAYPNKDRYSLYQSRYFNFGIEKEAKVLDVGSGNIPFPFATHLADFSPDDDTYGRNGAPMKILAGRKVYQCNVEELPFDDKSFDFVNATHILEHTHNPGPAFRELIRVAKRGFIETPARDKDIWMNHAATSNHHWWVKIESGKLIFNQYSDEELKGIGCGILSAMHCNPQTEREKAFAALVYLKADIMNNMFMWNESFSWEVHWLDGRIETS